MTNNIFDKFEKAYNYITNEEDARICKDISEESCRYTSWNFFIIIISNTFSKLGDVLANPKTVLAWLLKYLNAPLFLISFIVPIRESFSMLPQIVIANYIRRLPVRKWVWVFGSALQFASMVGVGIVALNFTGNKAGYLIIILLVIFSLSRGFCSIASKDILGKTIPKTRRGRLNGYSTSISGVLVIISGGIMLLNSNSDPGINYFTYIIFSAALLWLIASIVYATINEFPGETTGGRNGLKEALQKVSILKTDKTFRNFIIARSLLLCSALVAPFYIVLAQKYIGSKPMLLGIFIITNGLASAISAPYWGKKADLSSKSVLINASLMAAILGIIVFSITSWVPLIRNAMWFYPVVYFILGIAHDGVRLGRKTYIVDIATGDKRIEYVAVGNTIIGFILLITGGISALLSLFSVEGIVLGLSILGLIGAYVSSKLKDA